MLRAYIKGTALVPSLLGRQLLHGLRLWSSRGESQKPHDDQFQRISGTSQADDQCLRSASSPTPLSFCVVGSGPAGFYTTDKILKAFPAGHVTLLERLPSPFGLVRTGVAPDHPETKFVTNQFTKVASQNRCSYLGNVSVGRDVSLHELKDLFHAVVLAYGAEDDKKFGIPGENLSNCLSAREFVWWYNGHPDYVDLKVDLSSTDTAVVLGQGNVALDCARVLLRSREELEVTDIAEHAMEALRQSTIRSVHLVGRRGAAQAACTAKEVRELLGLNGVSVSVSPRPLVPSPMDEEDMKRVRSRKRVFDLLAKAASAGGPVQDKNVNFLFYRSPREILAKGLTTLDHHQMGTSVGGVRLEVTQMTGGGEGREQRAVGTGKFEDLPCGLVLRSIGYRSLPLKDLPFDEKSGTVPNVRGRILSTSSEEADTSKGQNVGLYAVGWLKRGPTGIIGTNEIDAVETVSSIVEDSERLGLRKANGLPALTEVLKARNIRYVTFDDWKVIDWEELRHGKEAGKQREKFVRVEDMLQLVGK